MTAPRPTPDDLSATPDERPRHDTGRRRFVVDLDGVEALASYRREGDTVYFTHTEVPEDHEGRGVGSSIARTALEWARAEGLQVVPQCPFIADYVKRHREYAALVPEEWRGLVER